MRSVSKQYFYFSRLTFEFSFKLFYLIFLFSFYLTLWHFYFCFLSYSSFFLLFLNSPSSLCWISFTLFHSCLISLLVSPLNSLCNIDCLCSVSLFSYCSPSLSFRSLFLIFSLSLSFSPSYTNTFSARTHERSRIAGVRN